MRHAAALQLIAVHASTAICTCMHRLPHACMQERRQLLCTCRGEPSPFSSVASLLSAAIFRLAASAASSRELRCCRLRASSSTVARRSVSSCSSASLAFSFSFLRARNARCAALCAEHPAYFLRRMHGTALQQQERCSSACGIV